LILPKNHEGIRRALENLLALIMEIIIVSGYVDGHPVYSLVRVLHQEFVLKIEDEIALKVKGELKPQSSETTLCD
jgi:hypothetical protein